MNESTDEGVARMKVANIVYVTLMCELLEERYGDQFIEMVKSVQDEMIMLVGDGMLETAVQCVQKKFDDPQYSIKQGLIDAMQLPKKLS